MTATCLIACFGFVGSRISLEKKSKLSYCQVVKNLSKYLQNYCL